MQRARSFQLVLLLFSLAMFCAATAIASPAQVFTTLVNFDGTDGTNPTGPLVQATDGNFYGTTNGGGANGYGTVFKMNPGGMVTTLYSFCAQPGCTDGLDPQSGLVQATDGSFYGTTLLGGGNGTVFKITPGGALTTLYSFSDAESPRAGLVQGTDGNFYGTTTGMTDSGTVFKITPGGTLTTLHRFNGGDGANPKSTLVQAPDGNLYGTTSVGGNNYCRCGTVFKITPGGTLTTLHSFDGADGFDSFAGLVQATDGNFYGTTYVGGANNAGTVFRITPGGTLTTLHSFDGTDGFELQATLIQATDGNFYGAAANGGDDTCYPLGCGTVFKMTPGGVLTTLHSFDGTDGSGPGALVQGTDGNFYGVTGGGAGNCNFCGTIFSLGVGLSPFVQTQPTSGPSGAVVTILGTNLTGANGVTFNGMPVLNFQVVSPTEITTNVPTGATTGLVQVMGTPAGTLTSNAPFQITSPVLFVPVTPCRLLDTRKQSGGSGPIPGGTFESFNLTQLAQKQGCADLSSAAAYSLNVTAVPPGPLGYLTVWPTGEIMPYVSTLNSVDGRVKANAAIVPSGSNSVSVFVSNTTDVVLDIDGYFTFAGNSTLPFYPLTPCRVIDTRNAPGHLGGPYLTGGVPRDFPVLASPCFNGGNAPLAYSFNMTVVPHGPLGYLTVWQAGQMQPNVSTLNAVTGTVVANAALVPAGTGGEGDIMVFASNDTDLVVDVNGYFAAPGSDGLSLYPMAPCRVLDTRNGNGAFVGELTVDVVDSACGPSNLAQAYVFNATVVPPAPLGYLTLWPDGGTQPGVSTLNAVDGAVTSNMAIVPTTNGSIDAFASNLTQLVLDVSAYFAP